MSSEISGSNENTAGENITGTIVEQTLRSQRDCWREIIERVAHIPVRDFPHEAPKRILLFGLGSSYFAAKLVGFALLRDKQRTRTPVLVCSSVSMGTEVLPQRGDWAFAFTHRGGGGPTRQAIELCHRSGAFTIQVCGKGVEENPFTHFQLETVPLERVEPHTASVTGAICAVSTLLIGSKAVEEWDALRSIGDPDLEVLKRRAGMGPTVLMGEWEGEWLAKEGALKLMEMAKLPVRTFGSEEYFHGPRFAAPKDEAIWHISLPNDPRNKEIRAAHRIDVFGATPLAWMPALVELQWLALAVSLNRGVDPDTV